MRKPIIVKALSLAMFLFASVITTAPFGPVVIELLSSPRWRSSGSDWHQWHLERDEFLWQCRAARPN
jgi:hypothetical protein